MITLLPFNENDFPRLISWIDSEKMLIQFAGTKFSYPLTTEQLRIYISEENRYIFKAIDQESDEAIGHADILCFEKDKGLIGRVLIGEKQNRGHGLGLKLMEALCDLGFNKLNLTELHLNVYDWNHAAIQCYTKIGFKKIHYKKQQSIYKDEVWNVIRMCLTKNQYNPLTNLNNR